MGWDVVGAAVVAHGRHADSMLLPALVVGGALMVVAAAQRVRWSLTRVLSLVAIGGLGFQLVHVLEHVSQAGYWAAHPTQAPWLTPPSAG